MRFLRSERFLWLVLMPTLIAANWFVFDWPMALAMSVLMPVAYLVGRYT